MLIFTAIRVIHVSLIEFMFVKQCFARLNANRLKVWWEIFTAQCIAVSYTFLQNFVNFYRFKLILKPYDTVTKQYNLVPANGR